MMKKTYIKPALQITYVEAQRMICASVLGVANTGNMNTIIDDEETDEYLARRYRNAWDEEEEDED